MAVAFDATSESHTGTTASTNEASFSWTHTPVGTPAGVTVFVFTTLSSSPVQTGVTYGGTSMTELAIGAEDTGAELGVVRAYHLGSSVPTGAQTVTVSRNNDSFRCYAVAITVTAAADTEVYLAGALEENENQAISEESPDDGSPGSNSLRLSGLFYGGADIPAAGANSVLAHAIDFGANSASVYYEATPGQGARPVGPASTASDDVAAIYFAVREAASADPTLTADSGSYTLTGTAAGVRAARKLIAAATSYTSTGATVLLLVGRKVVAEQASYTTTGTDAGLRATRKLTANDGTYTLTGTDAGLAKVKLFLADAGAYTFTGNAAGLRVSRKITAEAGGYTLTGEDAATLVARTIGGGVGSYLLTGEDATLDYGALDPVLYANAGGYAFTGLDAGIYKGYKLTGDSTGYTMTGQDAVLRAARRMAADAGGYALTGADAAVVVARSLTADGGVWVLSGQDAATLVGRYIGGDSAAYVLTGLDAVIAGEDFMTQPGVFTFTGLDVVLRRVRVMIGRSTVSTSITGTSTIRESSNKSTIKTTIDQ